MKKISVISILLFSSLAISCNEEFVRNVTTVAREFDLTSTVNIVIEEDDSERFEFFDNVPVQATQEDLDILTVELVGVAAKITNYNSGGRDVNLEELSITVDDTDIVMTLEEDVDVSSSVDELIPFEVSANVARELEEKILADQEFTYRFTVLVDRKPVEMTIDLIFTIGASGSALDF